MKPTHRLRVLDKRDESRTELGAGWLNADGSISITLNPCVTLTRDANLVLRLFPTDEVPSFKDTKVQLGKAKI